MTQVDHLLALDQCTSGSRSIDFDRQARIVAMAPREFRQIYPLTGRVAHDPEELWTTQVETAREVPPEVIPSSHGYGHTLPDLPGAALPIGGIAGAAPARRKEHRLAWRATSCQA